MRGLPALLVAALVPGLLVLQPADAEAAPAAPLCAPDPARGAVPADFALDACVDASAVTVRNGGAEPVLVRTSGDLGEAVTVHERGSAGATVLRLAMLPGTVLVPGDVVRWPLGGGAAGLVVSGPDLPATAPVVAALESVLPDLGSDDVPTGDYPAYATVARATAAAVADRAACVEGRNFLRVAACDVDAATAISRAATAQLPDRAALHVLSVLLDQARWADWAAPAPAPAATEGEPATLTLTVAPEPEPVPVPAAPAPAPVAPVAPSAPAPSTPAPRAPVPVPVPVPSMPSLPQLDPGRWQDVLDELLDRHLDRAGDGDGDGDGDGGGGGKGRNKGEDDD